MFHPINLSVIYPFSWQQPGGWSSYFYLSEKLVKISGTLPLLYVHRPIFIILFSHCLFKSVRNIVARLLKSLRLSVCLQKNITETAEKITTKNFIGNFTKICLAFFSASKNRLHLRTTLGFSAVFTA